MTGVTYRKLCGLAQQLVDAICANDAAKVEELLDNHASPNTPGSAHYRPLHHAACKAGPEVIRLLIARGACLEEVNEYGCTPLLVAVSFGREKNVEALLDAGADINALLPKTNETTLGIALDRDGCEDLAILLVRRGVNLQTSIWTPIFNAVSQKRYRVLRELQERGVSIDLRDKKGRTALMIAAEHGNGTAISCLIDAGADPNASAQDGLTPLTAALKAKEWSPVVELLLAGGADPDLPVHANIRNCQNAELQALLDRAKELRDEYIDKKITRAFDSGADSAVIVAKPLRFTRTRGQTTNEKSR
jgi:ankyrin repeat protein